jgi:hypothetical protein
MQAGIGDAAGGVHFDVLGQPRHSARMENVEGIMAERLAVLGQSHSKIAAGLLGAHNNFKKR